MMDGREMTRIALYARVSTTGQTTENQINELRSAAERHGWEIIAEFVDNGISGAKGRDQRPNFDALLKSAARREFDLIAAWSVDRLGRSLQDLVCFLQEIHAKGINLYLHQQGLDTTTPAGKAMFQMMGVFAEFEREMIRERINAGLARAKKYGTKSGRPIGRPKVWGKTVNAIHAARAQGKGIKKIASDLGVAAGTVRRVVRAGS